MIVGGGRWDMAESCGGRWAMAESYGGGGGFSISKKTIVRQKRYLKWGCLVQHFTTYETEYLK